MSRASPLVLVSVLNWNTAALTIECLRALRTSDYVPARVVVIDNASTDDSVARLLAFDDTLCVIRAERNLGFAEGHALALPLASAIGATAIWLVNSDALVEPQALSTLVSAWLRHGDAIYGGLPLEGRTTGHARISFPEKYLRADARPSAFERDRPLWFDSHWLTREPFAVAAVVGSSMLVPLSIIERAGWMDARWFLYCEEIDYCLSLRTQGIASYIVPGSRCWHGGGGSHRDSKPLADCIHYYRTRNDIVLSARHAGRWTAAMVATKKLLRAGFTWATDRQRGRLMFRAVRDAMLGRLGKTLAPEDWRG